MKGVPHREADSATLMALLLIALNLRPALAALGPVLEAVRTSLHLSHGIAGLLTTLPVICMGLFAPLALPLSAHWGVKHTVAGMLVLLAGATLWRMQATLVVLLVSSVLIGASLAILGPLLNIYIKQNFPRRSTRISAWVTTAICLGAALAASSSALLSDYLGWPCALGSWSLLTLVAAWQWQRSAPDPVRTPSNIPQSLPWSQPRAWLLMLMFGLHSMVFYSLLTWLAPAYVNFGLSTTTAGHVLGVFALMQIAGSLLVSALPGKQSSRRQALLISATGSLGAQLAIWLTPLTAPFLSVCLLGTGAAGLFALTLILPLDYSDSPEGAGSWTAMMCGGGYLIAAGGPYLCGVLLDVTGSYSIVFGALCLTSTIVLMIAALLPSPHRADTQDRVYLHR